MGRPPAVAVFLENRPFFGALLAHAPLLWELRRRHPGRRIVAFAPFEEAHLLRDLGAADALVRYEPSFRCVRSHLRELRPEAIYLLRPYSFWLTAAVGLQPARPRAGFRTRAGRLLLSRAVPHDVSLYRPRKYLALLPDLDHRSAPLDGFFRELAAGADRAALPPDPFVAVLPGGGAGAFKLWGVERFLAVCHRLAGADPRLRFLFVLGRAEEHLLPAIEAALGADRARVLLEAPVATIAAAALAAEAAVGNDCGPGHVFQMCGCPYVCVMSDHDARAPQRTLEWLDAPNRPLAQVSPPGAPITAVPVEPVAAAVQRASALRAGR
ncbi:MAG TPA: glycosyltransferase family 9 protein [bacterium]